MHGLILRALQGYFVATFGPAEWDHILALAGLAGDRFEPLLSSGPEPLRRVLDAASRRLGRPDGVILAEAGAFAVANPVQPALRRLLRFGGPTFEEFLHSLEELPDRARLALPVFDFPRLELVIVSRTALRLICHGQSVEPMQVMCGALRAMADEYGEPATIELIADQEKEAVISIRLRGACAAGESRRGLVSPARVMVCAGGLA